MTDAEWQASTDPQRMLEFVSRRASGRKLRLFGCACCCRAWHLMPDPRQRAAVEAAERYADGRLGTTEFAEVMAPVTALWGKLPGNRDGAWGPAEYMTGATRHLESAGGAPWAARFTMSALECHMAAGDEPRRLAIQQAEAEAQCALLRDLFGDPSRPFEFDPAWLAGDGAPAVGLARAIDEAGRFEDVPRLGEALARAGCLDRAVLDHCRGPGPHVRGCWVVDALLAREPAVCRGLVTEADWQTCIHPEPLLQLLGDKDTNRRWRLFAVACCRRIEHLMTDERSRRAVEVAARYADVAATEKELSAARAEAEQAREEAKDAEWVAEAEANFSLTAEYAAVCCRLYASEAAAAAVARDVRKCEAEPESLAAITWAPVNDCAVAAVKENVFAGVTAEPGRSVWTAGRQAAEAAGEAERRAHCDLLRDLFGEQFGPVGSEGRWLTRWAAEDPREQWCLLPTPRATALRAEWLAWDGGAVCRLAELIYAAQAFERLPELGDALEAAGCRDAGVLGHCWGPGPHARGCWVLDAVRVDAALAP